MTGPRSPFDGLQMPAGLACEFFAVFSRFEFALKEQGFLYVRGDYVAPSWRDYSDQAASMLSVPDGSELDQAITYLNDEPPQVQVGARDWKSVPLKGRAPVGMALDAAQRVRNNLFHGGKHTPHSPNGRDEKLVRAALCLLHACLEQDGELRHAYNQSTTY